MHCSMWGGLLLPLFLLAGRGATANVPTNDTASPFQAAMQLLAEDFEGEQLEVNPKRLLVEPWGEAGSWEWPDLGELSFIYKYRGEDLDRAAGFGVIEVSEEELALTVGLMALLGRSFDTMSEKQMFKNVQLDYRIQLSSAAASDRGAITREDLVLTQADLSQADGEQKVAALASQLPWVTAVAKSRAERVPQWNIRRVRGDYTLALNATGAEVVVAIIDSGCNINHPDLATNLWVNKAELNGQPGVDDDGNGYVDDVHGYNFVSGTGDISDDNGHGTHVAGIVSAVANSQLSVTGLAPSAKVMCLKTLDNQGSGFVSDAILAMIYAIENKAHIQNHSWGSYQKSNSLRDAVITSGRYGHLVVAAAGNEAVDTDEKSHYPSSYASSQQSPETSDYVLSVGASDELDNTATFSNFGRQTVDLAAPGTAITSLDNNNLGMGLAVMSGTSQATPLVAATAAAVLSILAWRIDTEVFVTENLTLYPGGLKEILLQTVDARDKLEASTATGGRLNAFSAVQLATTGNLSGIRLVQETPEGLPPTPYMGPPWWFWALIASAGLLLLLIAAFGVWWVIQGDDDSLGKKSNKPTSGGGGPTV